MIYLTCDRTNAKKKKNKKKHHCFIAHCQSDVIFKTLNGSNVVGVWWVNPAQPSQVLHVGQYHLLQDAWYDVGRRFGSLYVGDALCLQNRPA